jgi:hypothetical protein
MKPNLENLRTHYKNLSDEKLIELATLEARDLHEDAIALLKEEILSRNLSPEVVSGIDIQLNPVSEKTILDYCALVQMQPCPICGSRSSKLNAAIIEKVEGIMIATTHEKFLKIACTECLKGALNYNVSPGAALSLWGVFKGITASNNNDRMKSSLGSDAPNTMLMTFVYHNIGALEANKDNPEELMHMIKYPKLK